MAINREALTRWIRLRISNGDGGVQCTKIGLYQGKQKMGMWPTPAIGGTMSAPDMVNLIAQNAEEDIESHIPGRHVTYHVYAFFGESEDRDEAQRIRFALMKEWDEDAGDEGNLDEPTARGERAQDSRLKEKLFAMAFKEIDSAGSRLRAENDRLREQVNAMQETIDGYSKREIAMKEKEQELLDRKAERDLAAKKAEQESKIWMEAVNQAKLMTNVVMLALTTPKGQAIPEAQIAGMRAQGVKMFSESISDEQAIKIMPLMSEQQQQIMFRFAKAKEEGTSFNPDDITALMDSFIADDERTNKILSEFSPPQQAMFIQMMNARKSMTT